MNDERNNYDFNNKRNNQRSYPSYVIVSLTSGLIGALIFAMIFRPISLPLKKEINKENEQRQNITIETSEDPNIPEVVAQKTMESVVGITTRQVRESNDLFFGPTRQLVEGTGSGVLVSSDGYILTNSHVIAGGKAEDMKVLFIDGSEKDGNLVWQDRTLDLAIIKVEGEGLKAAELGNSDEVNIGEVAIAIGNPLGLEFERTVTSGIISGLNRSLQISEDGSMEGLIQTDASINSGNSGGPLLNKEGKVIGINTLKIKSVEGMGFAQPINLVKPVIDQIITKGEFIGAYIGITGEDAVRYQKASGIDFGVEYGVLIREVKKDLPAEKAGLKPGDIITSINGDKVESLQGLRKILYRFKPGESINLGIVRDKQTLDINLELTSMDKK
ncbi:MAG: trypsin-like peptidase domain-containing protein [Andreesenia angusta]|nr:trypsin-like peptidase domain-containing protein [Andreesenia angusta]